MKKQLTKLLNRLTPKGFNDLGRLSRTQCILVTGNLIIWIDNLMELFIYLFSFNIELPNVLKFMLMIGGFIFILFPWTYLRVRLSNFKFYRKYIKRNKIWINEIDEVNDFFNYNILSDLYIKSSEDTSDSVIINIKEVIQNHSFYGGIDMLNIIESYNAINEDFNNHPSLVSSYIENNTKKNITYVLDEDIYLINIREKNINDVLEKS